MTFRFRFCHATHRPSSAERSRSTTRKCFAHLRWAFEHVETVDLMPGAGRHVDLAEVSGDDPKHARLTITDAPREGLMLDAHGDDYTIEVLITGRNFRPVQRSVRLRHTGAWTGQDNPPTTAIDVNIPKK
jgi:hypothetical protein